MPWCHECEKEFPDEGGSCPKCEARLFEEVPPQVMEKAISTWGRGGGAPKPEWPLDEDGQPEKPVRIANISGSQIDYEMAAGLLSAYGVPNIMHFPGAGSLAKIYFGFSGAGVDLYVPETMAEDARLLLSSDEEAGA